MSGGEIALLHLLQALDRSLYVPLVVLGVEGPLVERLSALGIEVVVLPLDRNVAQTRKDSLKGGGLLRAGATFQSLRYALRLARLMRSRKVDLVHTNSLKADILGGLAARLARVPAISHMPDHRNPCQACARSDRRRLSSSAGSTRLSVSVSAASSLHHRQLPGDLADPLGSGSRTRGGHP